MTALTHDIEFETHRCWINGRPHTDTWVHRDGEHVGTITALYETGIWDDRAVVVRGYSYRVEACNGSPVEGSVSVGRGATARKTRNRAKQIASIVATSASWTEACNRIDDTRK